MSLTVAVIANPTMQRQRRLSFLRSINILHGNNPHFDVDGDVEEIDSEEEQIVNDEINHDEDEVQGLIDNKGRPNFSVLFRILRKRTFIHCR